MCQHRPISATSWDAFIHAAVKQQLLQHLQQHMPEHRAQQRVKVDAQGILGGEFGCENWATMWDKLKREFRPKLPNSARHRPKTNILVIGPGFGIKANPGQYKCLERAGFRVHPLFVNSPEDGDFDMALAKRPVLDAITRLDIHAVVSGRETRWFEVLSPRTHGLTFC